MTLRVGIISANWGAVAHLPAWRAVPGVEVVGICTSRRETPEAAASRFQVARPFWDAEAMIRDPEIDIVDCGTRPSIRHPMVLSALPPASMSITAFPSPPIWSAPWTIESLSSATAPLLPVHSPSEHFCHRQTLARLAGEGAKRS